MDILHVLTTPRAEGTVRLVIDWLGVTRRSQGVWLLRKQPDELSDQLRQSASWLRDAPELPCGKWKFFWLVWESWRICRSRRPAVVICWPTGFSAFVLLGARLAGIRSLIAHAGNPPAWNPMGMAYTFFTTSLIWLIGGKMVCCSDYVKAEYARSPGVWMSSLRSVHNAVPLRAIRERAGASRAKRRSSGPTLLMVATLEAHKDHSTLIRALGLVRKSVPAVRLWLAGEGSLRTDIEREIARLGLGNAVDLLGTRRDIPDLLGLCDLFVLSTTPCEGLGTVLIEALVAGCPVVASDVPACRELLLGGRRGKLCRAGDAESLAGAIIEALAETAAARAEISGLEEFSVENMMASYLRISKSEFA